MARGAIALLTLGLCGCEGIQSALSPLGPVAREIAALWWWMFGVGVAVFVLVLTALLYAVFSHPDRRRTVDPERMILGGGIVLPVVVLSILLPFGVIVGASVSDERAPEALTIRVRAHQWWWDIEYDDGTPAGGFTTANELYLPVGRQIELILTSADVIHSLWLPRLAGKLDLIPGRTNRLVVEADSAGILRGQCAEFCGLGHAKMALVAVAVPPEEFAAWADAQRRPAAEPEDELARRGGELFAAAGCALCHAVRGTRAWGRVGPDLTHVGGRLTIGAGLLDTTRDNLALWIAHNGALKPGNRMPDFADLDRQQRDAIAAYLESLE
ncbi:MAG: cytochrome c oxidase subunit II [Gammaproteobacteria bacterium]|nr:cytochrome c oxidase subunit II [Gammaproteobacteria bacterium]